MTASIERAYALTEIRAGRLQTIRPPGVHLPIDELCYYATPATRWKPMRNGVYSIQGQLIFSSKAIVFTAAEMGGQMPWKKVMRLYPQGADQVVIEGSAATLRGAFTVPDVEWVSELAATLIKIDRRQILDGSKVGRAAIPRHIKAEVWARDGGACRQCGMDGSGGASAI